jgi:hypothetical protein
MVAMPIRAVRVRKNQILDMLRDNRQLVVQGGPGSGKTWLALEQAFRYADEGLRVLLLCYNIALADQLSALVAKRKLKKGEVIVRSWAALARELFETVGLEWDEPIGPTESDLYFGEAHASLLFTHSYSRPVFAFLQTLRSDATLKLVRNLRYRTVLPDGPDVEFYTVKLESTAARLEEIVTRWVNDGFCRVDEILILSPRGAKLKTSLAGCSQIGEWPLATCVIRKSGELSLLSINKAVAFGVEASRPIHGG